MTKTNYGLTKQIRKLKRLLILTLIVCLSNGSLLAQYVHTSGTQILDENGNDIYFSGMNLGNWLLWEGYLMMGDFNYRTHSQFLQSVSEAFGNDMAKAKEFEHQWRLNYLTQQGISDLKSLGYNSVRVPFHYNMFWDGNTVKDDGFQYFDRVIEFCRNEGMYVMLDMHAAPGYQNPGDHSDNVNSMAAPNQVRSSVKFWDGNNVEIASEVWRHIANHYKNEPVIWGYDLINEPVLQAGREYELLGSMVTMRNAIREVDNNHIIIAEGNWWGSEMDKLDWTDPLVQAESGITARWDDNMVYQTHHYSTIVSLLDERLAICNKLDVPMILGEYGESDYNNIGNMTDWCISNNVDYFPWSFKKMSHDKCLWTIHPNEAYNQLKAFINYGTNPPSSLYDDMIAFTQNNISNGSAGLTWHQGFYDATKMPCDVGTPSSLEAYDISGESISVSWLDVSGESGYNLTCSNGQSVSLAANATSHTFSGLANDTNYTISVTAITDDCVGVSVTVEAETLCVGSQTAYSGTALALPGIIEGEDYDLGCDAYADMSDGNTGGLYRNDDVDITDGADGGYAIGWIDEGEWLEYTVDVANTATYDVEYVVASPDGTGEIQLQVDGETLATMAVPNTTDWSIYETATATVDLTEGVQVIRLVFSGSINFDHINIKEERDPSYLASVEITPSASTIYLGESINLTATGYDQYDDEYAINETWSSTGSIDQNGLFSGENIGSFTVTASDGGVSTSANISVVEVPACIANVPGSFEAEAYDQMSGIQTEDCSEGGQNVGWIDTGDWLQFDDICVASSGAYNAEFRVASQSNGGQFEIQDQDDNVLAIVDVPVTGGWQNWESVDASLQMTNSVTSIKLVVTDGGFNLNWMDYASIEDIDVTGVNISPISHSLSVGSTFSFTASVLPSSATNQSVSWSSSNPSVATVDPNGTITAVSIGEANITVETVEGAFTATSAVTVTAEPITGVQIPAIIEAEDYTAMSGIQTNGDGTRYIGYLEVDDFIEYEIYVPENGDFIIDFTYATEVTTGALDIKVDDVTVTTFSVDHSTGGWEVFDNQATLPFTLAQGSHILRFDVTGREVNFDKFEFSSTAPLSVSGVSVLPTDVSMAEGGTRQLSATVLPSGAANQNVAWSTSNSSVATISSSGLVTAHAVGNATIIVETEEGGYQATCAITVEDISSSPSSFLIEAEDYVNASGSVQAENTEDDGGGENLGYINDGDYTTYDVILPQSGEYKVEYRVASTNSNGSISLLLDEMPVSTLDIDVVTGGWQNWTTMTSRVDMSAGNYTMKLQYGGNGFNLNWINISYVGVDEIAPSTPNITSVGTVCYSAFVTWDESTDNDEVVAYHVFLDDAPYGESINGTSVTLSGLDLSTTYSIYVVAEDYSGNMSSPSATQTITTDDECNVSPDVSVTFSSSVRPKDHAWYSNGPFDIPYKLDEQESLQLVPGGSTSNMTINVDPAETYQSMFGVGASFERTTVENMLKLSPATRTELLTQLVHPTEGAGFNLFRIPIGTSDFTGTEWYSYADIQTDDLSNFSIERDKTGVSKTGNPVNSIQVIKEAIAINPDIKFFASPWSPPGWMTSNGIMPAGSFLSEYTDLYAKYLRLFIQAYRAEGIHIEALTLQNEPLHQTGSMPTMNLSPEQHADLAIALQREFDENGIDDCKIWVFDHNPQDLVNFVTPIWDNPEAYDIIDGSAVHDYGGPISEMGRHHDLWPNKNLYFTERSVWGTAGMANIVNIFRNWSRSYSSWVTMIDQNNEPNEGPFTADPTLFIKEVDNADGYYAIPELYMIGHFAKHIPIGSVRISSDEAQNQVSNVAWLTPDNKIVMIVVNNSNSDQDFTMLQGGYQFTATLPAATIATYKWENGLSSSSARVSSEDDLVENLESSVLAKLYPNPALSSLTITGLSDENNQIVVFGMDGRTRLIQSVSNSNEAVLDISNMEAGYFMLRVTNSNGVQQTLRFIKR